MRTTFIKVISFSIILAISCIFASKINPLNASIVEKGKDEFTVAMTESQEKEITDYQIKLMNLEEEKISSQINYIDLYKSHKEKISTREIYDKTLIYTKKYNIQQELMLALFITESNMYSHARSNKDCRGLGQISKDTLQFFNNKTGKNYSWEKDIYDYEKNIEVSCWYVRWLYSCSSFDNHYLLIAYNAGPYSKVNKFANNEKSRPYKYQKDVVNHCQNLLARS